jgi:hypothetical protein
MIEFLQDCFRISCVVHTRGQYDYVIPKNQKFLEDSAVDRGEILNLGSKRWTGLRDFWSEKAKLEIRELVKIIV